MIRREAKAFCHLRLPAALAALVDRLKIAMPLAATGVPTQAATGMNVALPQHYGIRIFSEPPISPWAAAFECGAASSHSVPDAAKKAILCIAEQNRL